MGLRQIGIRAKSNPDRSRLLPTYLSSYNQHPLLNPEMSQIRTVKPQSIGTLTQTEIATLNP